MDMLELYMRMAANMKGQCKMDLDKGKVHTNMQ